MDLLNMSGTVSRVHRSKESALHLFLISLNTTLAHYTPPNFCVMVSLCHAHNHRTEETGHRTKDRDQRGPNRHLVIQFSDSRRMWGGTSTPAQPTDHGPYHRMVSAHAIQLYSCLFSFFL
jgi:hypothetical protein